MSNLHTAWAQLFWRGVADAGVKRVVVSPGSRSTPLALAALETKGLEVVPVIDERAAAFVALGASRADGVPTAVLCTSGTAVAHWHPAIVEASQAFVPLLAVSADRPWEAQQCGASQTIPQARLFGDHVRAAFDLGVPDAAPEALRAVRRIAAQAVALSLGPTPGPVHVNAAFRKPLEPIVAASPEAWEGTLAEVRALGPVAVHRGIAASSHESVAAVARAIRRAKRGVVVAGPRVGAAVEPAVLGLLSERTGFPVLVESASGARFGEAARSFAGGFDAFLRAPAFQEGERPDLVLQVGMAPISAALSGWLGGSSRAARIVVAPHGWNDPEGNATEIVHADAAAFLEALCGELATRVEPADPRWRSRFDAGEAVARRAAEASGEGPRLTEPAVVRAVRSVLPAGAWLLASNSRPIRDLDSFLPAGGTALEIFHQRGAAGIDGLLAGAAGSAIARALPGAVLLGDVAAAHDVGSLSVLREVRTPLAVVVVDNGGGRIFDELPVGRRADLAAARAQLFTTAPALDLVRIATAFGLRASSVESTEALQLALGDALGHSGATVIVARVPHGGEPPRDALFRAVAKELA